MGRNAPKLASFCLNRLATRVRVRPPPAPPKQIAGGDGRSDTVPKRKTDEEKGAGGGGAADGKAVGRRVVVVVDPGRESRVAVQWALSHAVQSHDTVVLVRVLKPARNGGGESMETTKEMDRRSHQMFSSMRNLIQAEKPGVEVEVFVVEGKERGPAIVGEAEKQAASLLVLGQKKRSMTWRLVMAWAASGRFTGGGVVDYCIQNASCTTVAVRRKSRRSGGGYLITTKRHKDFWLLA